MAVKNNQPGGVLWIFISSVKVRVSVSRNLIRFVMSRITQMATPAQVVCMHLDEGDMIGYHEAAVSQLFLIISGGGFVRTDTHDVTKVSCGEAVFWKKGEWHETKTDTGLIAIVIESDTLDITPLIALKR